MFIFIREVSHSIVPSMTNGQFSTFHTRSVLIFLTVLCVSCPSGACE